MNHDQPQATAKAQTLHALTAGPLPSSLAELSGSSRCVTSGKDFHFYHNFGEFRSPIDEITRKLQSMLETIGTSAHIWGKEMAFPADIDDAYDWLVNVNDEVLERVDVSVDEFQGIRRKEEKTGRPMSSLEDLEDGFQLVCGKKKKGASHLGSGKKEDPDPSFTSGVKVATKDKRTTGPKPKVPFHIPTIRRPQDQYNIVVNNANQPFEHVWLQRSDDGQRFIHPLEKLSVLDFVDKEVLEDFVPVEPPSTECTPFKLVEEVKGLKELAAKLRSVNEFAVDLEHNQYRSFQGLTCLMQISTRTEDFVIDTLKLRIHVGPYLREVFKDPTKRKVMHGADRDIAWLQRDFGIYVCNLFDTGQASRVLKLERYSLEYLLHHFCGVTANKEYQNADWRLRPLPDEMLRYGREDTHYLLYIYDLMRIKLFALSKESESSDNPLMEVYKRSYDVCMLLYEKELLTENSYLHIYGLQGAGFNAQQLAIVSGLCEWRDIVARAEDESTGYVLPNKILLEIAKQMPVITNNLRRLVKSKHSYVERNLDTVVSIIRHAMQNAAAFEEAALHLKEAHATTSDQDELGYPHQGVDCNQLSYCVQCATSTKIENVANVVPVKDGTDTRLTHMRNFKVGNAGKGSIGIENATYVNIPEKSTFSSDLKEESFQHQDKELPRVSLIISEKNRDANESALSTAKGNGANVQVLKKPTGAFGALLGNSASKRKLDPDKKGKEEIKLDQIRSSVNLPFHSFLGNSEKTKIVLETPNVASETSDPQKPVSDPVSSTNLIEIIMIDSDTDSEYMLQNNLESSNDQRGGNSVVSPSGKEDEDEPMSLSELSSSFQKCLQPNNQNDKTRQTKKAEDRENVSSLGDDGFMVQHDSGSKKKSSTLGQGTGDITKEFPASGNRSAAFR